MADLYLGGRLSWRAVTVVYDVVSVPCSNVSSRHETVVGGGRPINNVYFMNSVQAVKSRK